MSHRRIRSAALATAGCAAVFGTMVALSPTASADPAPSPIPAVPGSPSAAVPGIDVIQQLASAAGLPRVLQSAASALSGAPAAPASAPSPLATAAVSVPQLPLPTGTDPQSGLAGVVPTPQANLPKALGLPGATPGLLSLPGDLSSLMSGLGGMPSAAAAAAPAASAPGQAGLELPLAGLP